MDKKDQSIEQNQIILYKEETKLLNNREHFSADVSPMSRGEFPTQGHFIGSFALLELQL